MKEVIKDNVDKITISDAKPSGYYFKIKDSQLYLSILSRRVHKYAWIILSISEELHDNLMPKDSTTETTDDFYKHLKNGLYDDGKLYHCETLKEFFENDVIKKFINT